MGSYNHIYLENLSLFWSKNFPLELGFLFQESDKTNVTYHYADNISELKPGFSRKLEFLGKRLDLYGCNLKKAKEVIEAGLNSDEENIIFTIDSFVEIIKGVNLKVEPETLKSKKDLEYDNLGNFILNSPNAMETAKRLNINIEENTFRLDCLDQLCVLRIFASLENFHSSNLIWTYYDLVEGGWIQEDTDLLHIDEKSKYLIITEGKTDTEVLSKSIKHLYPEVYDFFTFVDMENHPFGGVNDVVKFCRGLKNISHSTNTLIILDNDVAGNNAFDSLERIDLPKNMKPMLLPRHVFFSDFRTMGTNGETRQDINGRAVSIEGFLDIGDREFIRWTEWKKEQNCYHGKFDDDKKFEYLGRFRAAIESADRSYDFSRLKFLIEIVIEVARDLNDAYMGELSI